MPRSPILAPVGLAIMSGMAVAQTAPAAPAPAAPAPQATAAPQQVPTTPDAPTAGPTIASAAASDPRLSTLAGAVRAADLATTLAGPGPYTVFAPENEAFTRLAPGTMDTLLKPENKPTLVKVLSYHVVPGRVTLAQLREQIRAGGGKATLTTVEGSPLIVAQEGAAIKLTDVSGNRSYIAKPDVEESNGVIHVVNGVVVPRLPAPAPAS